MRIVLIPVYEPDEKLIRLLEQLSETDCQILIVNDGSGSGYEPIFELARKYAQVIGYEENGGKGVALKTGLAYIRDHFTAPYTVVTVDGDGQHSVRDAVVCCERSEAEPGSLILGSRGLEQEVDNVPLRSRIGHAVTRYLFQKIIGFFLYDAQSGLRAFSDELVPAFAELEGERYEYEMFMLFHCADHGIPIQEIPVEKIYLGNNETSHFRPFADSMRFLKLAPDRIRKGKGQVILFALSSFIGFVTDFVAYAILITLLPMLTNSTVGMLSASNIIARVISASVNYTINRKLTFGDKGSVAQSAFQYFLLAVCILVGNTVVLNLLVEALGVNAYAAKPLVEVLFFVVSWLVQKHVIFRKKS